MIINYTFDNSTNPSDTNSWANAPAGVEQQAQAAFAAVAQMYDTLFTNNVTLNITVQWGTTPAGAAAGNNGGGGGIIFTYAQVLSLLQGDENSSAQQLAFGNLPNTDPTGSNAFSLTVAEAEALGLSSSQVNSLYQQAYGKSPPSTTITISPLGPSTTPGQPWTFNDFFSAAAHETSEIMGRNANVGVLYTGLGSPNGPVTNQPLYTPLDLFRYTASGQFDATYGTTNSNSLAFFGYDNGQVVTPEAFNNGYTTGDRGDWAVTANAGGDVYGAIDPSSGALSGIDLTVMNLLGWNLANVTVAQALSVYAADPYVSVAAPTADTFVPSLFAPGLSLVVVDSSSNFTQSINSLGNIKPTGAIASITFTDPNPIVSVTSAQILSDASIFALITSEYALSIAMSGSPITFELTGSVTKLILTGSGDATFIAGPSNEVFDIEAQGNHTINAGGTGNYTINSTAGTTTLDYTSISGFLTVDVATGTVTKPGGGETFTATDIFTNAQIFDGGSGTNLFQSIGTGDYTFTAQGTNNTLDYSADTNGVTINLATDTVTKDLDFIIIGEPSKGITEREVFYQDNFSGIQTFVGSGSGSSTFQSIGTGDYTFAGQGTNNTLDYSADTNGVTINLATDTVTKDLDFIIIGEPSKGITEREVFYQDNFSGIQTFVGSGSGSSTFQSIGTGDYTFTGQGTNNTLDYSADTNGVTINLASDTVTKDLDFIIIADPLKGIPGRTIYYQDNFSGIQTFTGGLDAVDTIVFSGASSQYTIVNNANGGVTVTDGVSNQDGVDALINLQFLQFTDKTVFVEDSDNANIARLYSAAFNSTPDPAGLSFWEGIYANNISAAVKSSGYYIALAQTNDGSGVTIADGFIQSGEFQHLYGTLTDGQFITQMYENVLGRAPDTAGYNFWLSQMQAGTTQAMVLVGFAESPENVAKSASWLFTT